MIAQSLNFGKFDIEICSYQLASQKWSPKVILREDRKYEIKETPLTWKREFETEERADSFALAQAKMWIERNG